MTTLTITEQETVRRQAERIMRRRLEERAPQDRTARIATATLNWSRIAALPLIALLATCASAIRTAATVYIIYAAATSHFVAAIAAFLLTITLDGSIYLLALAQKANHLRRVQLRIPRRVRNLADIWRGIQVRLGTREPLQWHELPESDYTSLVLLCAFTAVLISNFYIGLQALGDLDTPYPGLAIAVDLVLIIIPPAISLIAGHQAAAYAAEVAQHSAAFMPDDPLTTDEGRELLEEALKLKAEKKAERYAQRQPVDPTPATYSDNGQRAHVAEQ